MRENTNINRMQEKKRVKEALKTLINHLIVVILRIDSKPRSLENQGFRGFLLRLGGK